MHHRSHLLVVLVSAIFLSTISVRNASASSLGLYAGIALGQSHIQGATYDPLLPKYSFSGSESAWALRASIRPISWGGAELEYADFGKVTYHNLIDNPQQLQYSDTTASIRQRSFSAFGVAFIPLPASKLSFYAKIGMAHVEQISKKSTYVAVANPGSNSGTVQCQRGNCSAVVASSSDEWGNRLAYGAGIQVHAWKLLVRADYESISLPQGDTRMTSLGAAWKF